MASNMETSKLEENKENEEPVNGQEEKPSSSSSEVEKPSSSSTSTEVEEESSPKKLPRSRYFMREADINTALGDGPDLIGDLTKPYALPYLVEGTRHSDLKTISSETLARLIQGKFVQELGPGGSFKIIDCRYPYEYAGGHIRGAKNYFTTEQILKAFPSLSDEEPEVEEGEVEAPESPRRVYVFHCEFSSERAPKLLRFLRNHDRHQNSDNYPQLDYPELYLLHQGYNAFYGTHAHLCEPPRYVRMLSPTHREAFRQCRLQVTLGQPQTE